MKIEFSCRRQVLLANVVVDDYETLDLSAFRSALKPVEERVASVVLKKSMLDFSGAGYLPTAVLTPLLEFLLWVKADRAEIWLVGLPAEFNAIAEPVFEREGILRVGSQKELPDKLRFPVAAQR